MDITTCKVCKLCKVGTLASHARNIGKHFPHSHSSALQVICRRSSHHSRALLPCVNLLAILPDLGQIGPAETLELDDEGRPGESVLTPLAFSGLSVGYDPPTCTPMAMVLSSRSLRFLALPARIIPPRLPCCRPLGRGWSGSHPHCGN